MGWRIIGPLFWGLYKLDRQMRYEQRSLTRRPRRLPRLELKQPYPKDRRNPRPPSDQFFLRGG